MRRFSYLGLVVTALAGLLLAGCAVRTGSDAKLLEEAPVDGVSAYRDGAGKTGLTGRVVTLAEGTGLSRAFVNVYPDTTSNLLGPSQFISSPTDAEGRYLVEVPPGTYYIVARKRISGEPSGPLAPGDYYSEHKRIVAEVQKGKLAIVDLEVVPMKAPMFFKKTVVERETDTGIRGRLLDAAGQPVPGSFAIAYVDAEMKRLPDFASTLTDSEGRFTLYLPEGGTYFLGGRIHAWDMPRPGELYGKYGGEPAAPVEVTGGEFVEGLVITLTPFSGEYKEGKSRRPF